MTGQEPIGPEAAGGAASAAPGQGPRAGRRDCLRLAAALSGGLAVGSTLVAAGLLPRHGDAGADPVKVVDELAPGESVTFDYPTAQDRAIGLRLADDSLVGYSAVCTHLGCGLLWRPDRGVAGELVCPCHQGAFDVRTGEVTAGPPPRGLPKVVLVEDPAGAVWAIGTARPGESEEHGVCRELRARNGGLARDAGCDGPTADPSTPADGSTTPPAGPGSSPTGATGSPDAPSESPDAPTDAPTAPPLEQA
ncbi:Rieske 2Fe-2S domain-containing protein [Kitasatospora sp. LaBMicrA B282]|uniref:Rieske (2Fe-2S) protein n=1 Tax=Kitasatospora sp. LaBMicrA B282 TaxID=3420949 RepID=UPI003D0CCF7B